MKKFLSVFIAGIMALSLVACSSGTQKQADSGRDRKGRPNDEIVVSMGARIPHEFDPKDRYGMYNEAHITHSTLLRTQRKIRKGGVFEAFEREITGMQEETNNDLIYAFLDYVLSDNRYREKLNELTEINLKDRKIYIEETENHDDENDRVDNRKYEKLDENMEDDFLESED